MEGNVNASDTGNASRGEKQTPAWSLLEISRTNIWDNYNIQQIELDQMSLFNLLKHPLIMLRENIKHTF